MFGEIIGKALLSIEELIEGYVEERYYDDELAVESVSYKRDSIAVKFNGYFYITGEPNLFDYFADSVKDVEEELLDIITRNSGLPHTSLIKVSLSDTYVGPDIMYRGVNKITVTWDIIELENWSAY